MRCRWIPVTFVTLLLGACAADPPPATRSERRPIPTTPPSNDMTLREVMDAKLLHTQDLLEAMALEDFPRIEQSARQLGWLSALSVWQVDTGADYQRLSEEFRTIAETLAAEAENRDLMAVLRAHDNLTASCVDCHAWLRGSGRTRGVPDLQTRGPAPWTIARAQ